MNAQSKYVRYSFPEAGITIATVAQYLKIGRIYEIKCRTALTSITVIVLKDFPDLGFDARHFESINIDEKDLQPQ